MTDYEFRIPNWDRFQHYKKKTDDGKPARRPPWIKVYTKLLDDPDYLDLTPQQRALLHGLWLWQARHGDSTDITPTWHRLNHELYNRLLAASFRISTWKALETHGFIHIRASTGAGDNTAVDRPEVEGEGERTTSLYVVPQRDARAHGLDADDDAATGDVVEAGTGTVEFPDVPGWQRPTDAGDVLEFLAGRRAMPP